MLDKLNHTDSPEMLEDFLTAERNPYTGQRGIMDRTDRPHYNKFCEGIIECLKPATPFEQLLAFSIAADYWRLNRTRNIEDGIFASSHPNPTSEFGPVPIDKQIAASQTSAFLCRQSDFKFLSTYEMRVQRTLNRHKTDLKQLQAERRKRESQQALVQDKPDPPVSEIHQPDLIPAQNGFEFSDSPQTAPAEPTKPPVAAPEPPEILTAPVQAQPAAPNGFVYSNPALAPVSPAATRRDPHPGSLNIRNST